MIGGDPIHGYHIEGMWVEDVAYNNDIVDMNAVEVDGGCEDMQNVPDVNENGTERDCFPPLD